ncbi:MAG: DUF1614 domain-containing protein [Limnochordaceae bacterium]|nr:DUF1614 domain-containing protein [Limnochordaceae bacterium]
MFLLLFGLPVLFVLFYANVATLSFARLGLSPEGAFWLFALSLVGGMVNIPVSRRQMWVHPRPTLWDFFYYFPPRVEQQVIAVNVGGCLIPLAFSLALLLLQRAPLSTTLIATVIVTLVTNRIARPVPGRGIVMPAFLPPLVTLATALLLAPRGAAAPVAYVSGTVGTLIGADLLHLPSLRRMGPGVLSIGGAGVFDGIFLVGIAAAILA